MTDYRQLCRELLDDLELCDWPHKLREVIRADIDRARAALVKSKSIEDRIAEADAAIEASIERVRRIASMPAREIAAGFALARAALAEPEPEGPTDAELNALWNCCGIADEYGHHEGNFFDFARAVLARWGRPAPEHMPVPVPVSERLPEPEDCDAEGRCWWGAHVLLGGIVPVSWRFVSTEDRLGSEVYWLPAHALPMPRHH